MLIDRIVIAALVFYRDADNVTCLCTGELFSRNNDGGTPTVEDSLYVPDGRRIGTAATATMLDKVDLGDGES